MTTDQADAVHTLLAWLLQPGDHTPSNDDAQDAAVLLADAAHTTTGNGPTGADVTEMWPDLLIPAMGGHE